MVQPGLHVHWPLEPQAPFKQLQDEGGLDTTGARHNPVPVIPSSQEAQPAGHGEQFGPKEPGAQDSHEDPVNPVGHEHVPDAVQIPAPAHGGEQAADCISKMDNELDS